jgi:hypothetical protein
MSRLFTIIIWQLFTLNSDFETFGSFYAVVFLIVLPICWYSVLNLRNILASQCLNFFWIMLH